MHATPPPAPSTPAPSTSDVVAVVGHVLQHGLLDHLAERLGEKLVDFIGTGGRPEPLLTVDDVADHLRVSKRTVETLIAEGELLPLRIRTRRVFTRDAIDAYLHRIAAVRPG